MIYFSNSLRCSNLTVLAVHLPDGRNLRSISDPSNCIQSAGCQVETVMKGVGEGRYAKERVSSTCYYVICRLSICVDKLLYLKFASTRRQAAGNVKGK